MATSEHRGIGHCTYNLFRLQKPIKVPPPVPEQFDQGCRYWLTTLCRYLYFCKYLKYYKFYCTLQKFISIFTRWSTWSASGGQWGWFFQLWVTNFKFACLPTWFTSKEEYSSNKITSLNCVFSSFFIILVTSQIFPFLRTAFFVTFIFVPNSVHLRRTGQRLKSVILKWQYSLLFFFSINDASGEDVTIFFAVTGSSIEN